MNLESQKSVICSKFKLIKRNVTQALILSIHGIKSNIKYGVQEFSCIENGISLCGLDLKTHMYSFYKCNIVSNYTCTIFMLKVQYFLPLTSNLNICLARLSFNAEKFRHLKLLISFTWQTQLTNI